MPPRLPDPTNPAEWLRTARSDLALARAGRPTREVLYEPLRFHAQQAAEKAIKAILVSLQIDFPKTHEVGARLKLVEDRGIPVADPLREASDLTPYAVAARYPGMEEDVDEVEYGRAVDLARRIVEWAESVVRSSTKPTDGTEQSRD